MDTISYIMIFACCAIAFFGVGYLIGKQKAFSEAIEIRKESIEETTKEREE